MAGWSPYGEPTKPEDTESPTWGDYGTTFKAGLQDLQSAIQAGARYLNEVTGDREGERYYRATGKLTDMDVQETLEGLTPAARKRLTATVTSEDFWSHPFSSVALKGTRMTPTLAASIVPAFLLPGAGAATAGAAVAGGALTAAQTLDDLYQQVDEAPEEKLREVPYYAGLRSLGMSDEDARRDYGATIRGNKPAMMFLLGVLTNAVGPAGQIARATKGATASATGTGGNILTRTGKGFAEGALSEAVEEGAQNSAVQSAAIQGGLQKEFDYGKLADATLEGALLGGVFGGAAGLASRGNTQPSKVAAPVEDNIEIVGPKAPAAAERAALDAAQTKPGGQATTPAAPLAPEVPENVAQASERLAPKADPLAGIQTQGGGGGMTVLGAGMDGAQVPPQVAAAAERVKSKASAPEPVSDPDLTSVAPAPEGALEVPPDAGEAPIAPVTPEGNQTSPGQVKPTGHVLRPVGEEEAAPEMVAKLKDLAPKERAEKGSIGSKDTKTLAKRKADADLARQAFDEINADMKPPASDAERKTLAKRVKAIVDGLEGLGIKIPAKAAYKHAKNPTPDSLVWAREMKDLLTELEKDPKGTTASAKRDERVNTKLANWRLAKETGDFTQMRDDRIAAGAQAKSGGKGGTVDSIAAPVKVEEAAASDEEALDAVQQKIGEDGGGIADAPMRSIAHDEDSVQTGRADVAESRKGARIDDAAETRVVRSKDGDEIEVTGAKAASEVRKVAITDELRRQYETAGATPPANAEKTVASAATPAEKVAAVKEKAAKRVTSKGNKKVEEVKAKAKAKNAPTAPARKDSDTTQARITAAAKTVNTAPSDAQKEAGNYAKGHVRVQGLDIAIETPKGAKRSGKDPSGKTWEVTMPAHYGDVKRTEGADGDKVDVYVGEHPDSPHVLVIDQLDLATGKFDEHKVMLGFVDPDVAIRTYERAFSDGKGFDRIGKTTPMTVEEFKTWLKKGDTTKPAADVVSVDASPRRTWIGKGDEILFEYAQTPQPIHGNELPKRVESLFTRSSGEVLQSLQLRHLDGVAYIMFGHMRKQLLKFVPDVPVHFVDDKGFAELKDANPRRNADLPVESIAAYASTQLDSRLDHVVINLQRVRDRADAVELAIHELTHIATARALKVDAANDREFTRAINRIMWEVRNGNPLVPLNAYGFTNEKEFVAEAFSNEVFQRQLAETRISDDLANALGLKDRKSAWDAVLSIIRALLGLPMAAHTALEATVRVTEILMEETKILRHLDAGYDSSVHARPVKAALDNYASEVKEVFTGAAKQEQQGSPRLLKIATFNQIASISERFFSGVDGVNPVKKLYDLREARRVRAEKILRESEPLAERHVQLERKYQKVVVGKDENGAPITMWDNYAQLVHDETYAGVFADKSLDQNTHLGKDTLEGAWPKEQHARLAAVYNSLPEDLKALRRDTMAYYTAQQNQMSLDIIKNRVLVALGVDDASMAQRIFDETQTDDDVKAVGGKRIMDLILAAGALKKIKGPYYPLMRHGGYVVRGLYKITPPVTSKGNLVAGTDNVFEFKDRDDALEYARQQDARPTVKSVWVDENTGKTYGVDEDGKEVKITSKDDVAEQRWRVTVQDKHVEFFATAREALRAAKELEDSGAFRSVAGVEEKRFEPGDLRADMVSSEVRHLKEALERRASNLTPMQKYELEQALNEASIRFMGSTRIQSRRLPRTYVAGASKDLTRVMWEYANSVSGYIAKLEYAPRIERARKAIRDQVSNDASKDTSLGRSAIANEIERRELKDDVHHVGAMHTAAQRLMTVSFIDKLASPAYSVVGAMQAAVVGMPVLAGRHGVGASVSEMTKAYNDVAGFSIIKHALGEVGRAFKGDHHKATYLEDIKSRIRDEGERKMLEMLEQLGTIDADAGLELSELSRAQPGNTRTSQVLAWADKALGYVENIARQMPKAVEVINRSVMALSAYRLEMRKTGNHDRAVAYAQKVVDETQFNYSTTNAAPVFNHPLAKLALQFRKYGQALYYLLGSQVGKAYRGGSHGERAEALKTLGLIATTHMAVAGALGLPTEPIKYLLMGAKAFGLTATGWDDVEEIVRQYAAQTFGKAGGEIFSKGLPRALGLDVSSRMGLDSLVAFGEPKSDKENDVKKWLFDTLAGAPAALVTDYIKGTNHLWSGEFVKAAELMVPLKVAADSIRAYRQSTEGKKASTGRQLSEPYSLYEAGLRVVGFTPAREAEEGAKAAAFRNQTVKAGSERSRLVNAWINAKGADKVKAQRAVQQYNSGVKSEYRITQKDLTNAMKRREREGTGIITNRRTEPTRERLEQIYQ